MRARLALYLAGARNKKEITEVRYAGAAEMREAEAEYGRLVVFVACGRIIIVVVGIRADLDAAERNLSARVAVTESVCADEWVENIGERRVSDKPMVVAKVDFLIC